MIFQKIIIGISVLAFLLAAGCSSKTDEGHRTWMDLAKINSNIAKEKQKAKVDMPDNAEPTLDFNEGPKVFRCLGEYFLREGAPGVFRATEPAVEFDAIM